MGIKFILAASLVAAALVVTGCNASFQKPKIGIILSKLDNGFITSLQNAMFEADAIIGSDDMTMIPLDSKGDQDLQNKQIDDLIAQKVQVIAVNLIKRTAALDIIGKARGAPVGIEQIESPGHIAANRHITSPCKPIRRLQHVEIMLVVEWHILPEKLLRPGLAPHAPCLPINTG